MALLNMIKKNEIALGLEDYTFLVIGAPKSGKDLRNGTPVLTNRGWVNIEELTMQDKVYGIDGKVHDLLGIFPQGKRQCYEITFSDGTKIESSATHLWEVIERVSYKKNNLKETMKVRKVMELGEILKVVEERGYKQGSTYRFEIPMIENPIEYNKKELSLNPYLMGALLGDGGFSNHSITFTNIEEDILSKVARIVNDELNLSLNGKEDRIQKIIVGEKGNKNQILISKLKELGLFSATSTGKFIPREFLESSIEDRIQLLQGLIDTDGYIKACGNANISTVSPQLRDDICELVRSLGGMATISIDKRVEGMHKNICYVVNVMFEDNSIVATSKKHIPKIKNNCKLNKIIVDIKKTDIDDTTCIAINAPRHLFVTKDFIVTHNTTLYADLVKEFYGDSTKGLLIPFEKGYRAIKDVQVFPYTIQPKTVVEGRERDGWGVFVELVQELVDTKEENGIKLLCIDTIDEFFEVASAEVIRQSFIKDKKKVATLNEAFGGFARGTKVLARIVTEQIEKLKNAGYGIMFLGHSKWKTIKLKSTEEEYNMFGSNLTDNIFSIISNSVDMITMITIEKNIVNGILQGEERKIRFRDDGYYLAGSRFDNLPDTIPYGAKNFKDAYIKAIREKTAKSDEQFEEHLKEQEEIKEAKAKEFINSEKAKVLDKEALIEKLKETCKTDKRVASELMKIVQEHGISLATPKLISDDMFDLIMQQTGVRP